MITRRSFIGMLSASTSTLAARRIYVFAPWGGWRATDDKVLTEYVNQLVNANIVPILGYAHGQPSHVDNGVCRELYVLRRDAKFGIEYPLHHPWGIPPDPFCLPDQGVLLIKRPLMLPLMRMEVIKPRPRVKPVKITAQELTALDNDPNYLYGYGRGLDQPC
jgi:hypothetical protein